ncbi:AT-rich interactive domain-containing protein 1-like isoform X2 [Vicia villosa]|nr:AT-rich interactive domain-containing protein 1-like isoform X2 [Vicia villosa]XP_058754278.1 AT-rich interactive domain-containing protein 1-like isoform X2 [Vicia villosa]
MESLAEVKALLSDQTENVGAGDEVKGGVESEMTDGGMINETDVGKMSEGNGDAKEVMEEVDGGKAAVDATNVVNSDETGLLNGGGRDGGLNDTIIIDSDLSGDTGKRSGLKRKRDSLSDMMSWITRVANNPCDPEIDYMPEKSKWNSYDNQEAWKQVLLFREAVFHKKPASIEKLNWQNQKMHPCLYDDAAATAYNLRERLKQDKKLLVEKPRSASQSSSNSSSDERLRDSASTPSSYEIWADACICVGESYQARLPECTGSKAYESDPKWFGTQVWPSLEAVDSRFLIERDPIGKGRQESCGCAVSGSIDCVRFHVSERKAKMKLELGAAYYQWQFDKIGEDVRHLWSDEDERKFTEVIQSNPPSSARHFWDHIFRSFPNKSSAALVSYYFNVYLLQRRAYHSRHTADDINSDDEESTNKLKSVFGHQKSRDSVFLTPKKRHRKRR